MIAFRGTPSEVGLGEWLLQETQGTGEMSSTALDATQIQGISPRRLLEPLVAFCHLKKPAGAAGAQETLSVLRTVAELANVEGEPYGKWIAFRGTEEQVKLGERLVQSIDKPLGWQPPVPGSDNKADREHRSAGGRAPVFDVD